MPRNRASQQESPALLLALLVTVSLLGFALRLYDLDADSLWIDEISTATRSRLDPISLLKSIPSFGVGVELPLIYVVTRFFVIVFRENEFILRMPAVLFGSLSVLLTYKVGAILWTRQEGLIGGLLLAINAYHVTYSQEARPYALMMFLALLSLVFLLRALQQDRKSLWAGFVLCMTLSLYTHYFAVLFLAAELLFGASVIVGSWLSLRSKGAHLVGTDSGHCPSVLAKPAVGFLASLALVGLAYLPWLPKLQGLVSRQVGSEAAGASLGSVQLSLRFLGEVFAAYTAAQGVVLLFWLGLCVVGLATAGRQPIALALLWMGLPFAFFGLLGPEHFLHPRYVLFILPLCLLVIARGVLSTSRFLGRGMQAARGDRTRLLVAVSAFVALFGISSVGSLTGYYASRKEEWRSAARYLGDNMQPGDIVVADGKRYGWGDSLRVDRGLSYYLARHGTADAPIFPVGRGLWGHLGDSAGSNSQVWGVLWYPGRLQAAEAVTVVHFHQVAVVRLRQRSADTLEDTVSMLHVLVDLLPAEADFDVHLALAEIYLRTGRPEQAGLELHMASRVKPDSPEASQDLADARAEWAELCCSIENIQHPLWRSLGDVVAFLGYDIHPPAQQRAERVEVSLWWQALDEMHRDYSVFIHVVDQGGRIWAQQDRLLLHDELPTSTWLPGETVKDEYELQLPPGTPPGEYAVKTGIYYWETGERLPVWDENWRRLTDDAISLGVVTLAD